MFTAQVSVQTFVQSSKIKHTTNVVQNQEMENELISIARTALETESNLYVTDSRCVESKDDACFENAMQSQFDLAIKDRESSQIKGFYYNVWLGEKL